MTFDNIYHLLLWYFRKSWLNPPKMPGNHLMKDIRWKKSANSIQEVWDTAHKIRSAVNQLTPRDKELIRLLFTKKTTDDVANQRNLTERRIRQMRAKIIEKLSILCIRAGLLGVGRIEEPVVVRE